MKPNSILFRFSNHEVALSIYAIGLVLIFNTFLLLTACGGGGGGDSAPSDIDNTTSPVSGINLALDFSQGDYWEYFWFDSTSTFAQASSTTTNNSYGIFRVTLGATTSINGLNAFPIVVTGDSGNYTPRWTHVAVNDNGSLMGSTDGLNFVEVFDATTGEWNGGGFFVDFSSYPVTVSSGLFEGEYNSINDSVRLSYSASDGGCEYILGEILCSDTSTSFSFYEYYKQGIGPIGYRMDSNYTSDSVYYTSTTIQNTIELIESSEIATDGAQLLRPDWEEMAPLPTALENHKAVVLNGEIYVLGGYNGNNFVNSVYIYTPSSNQWRNGAPMPTIPASEAEVIGGKIYVESSGSDEIHVYDPSTTSWTTIAVSNPGVGGSFGDSSDTYVDATWGNVIIGVDAASYLENELGSRAYSIDSNQWLFGAPQSVYEMLRSSVSVIGDNLYLTGGFGAKNCCTHAALDIVYRYNIANDNWDTSSVSPMNTARDNLKTVVLSGKLMAIGGNAVSCSTVSTCNFGETYRSAEIYDPLANTWSDVSSMLNPRQDFAAVELNGDVYVIGGDSGSERLNSMERYRAP